ncbi:hypothetical protein F5Y14DRAFT_40683 [Nemania sp. NC0429]|nr:hypothetical protein F5Y14DRAFT_40683 [Nemania sp. NC0429]
MITQWLRAFRPAAHNLRQARLAVHPTRPFHSTVPRRGTEDGGNTSGRGSGNGNGNGNSSSLRDDERSKPGDGAGNEVPGAAEDNFLGETAAIVNGESQGRTKPTQGLRARALRNHKSNLPPVQIPKSFFDLAIDRHGEVKTWLNVDSWAARHPGWGGLPPGSPTWDLVEVRNSRLYSSVSWEKETVQLAIEMLDSQLGVSAVTRRLDALRVSIYWRVLQQIRAYDGDEAYFNVLASTPPPDSPDWVDSYLSIRPTRQPTIFQKRLGPILMPDALIHGKIPLTAAVLFEPSMVDEIVTNLRAEFYIQPPKNSRPAMIRRPVTIVNVQHCSGFSVAQSIMRQVAEELEADILHLRAHDIAHIVGRHVGQDVTRSPGDIALLGYKAAENAGRLKPTLSLEEEHENADHDENVDIVTLMTRHDKTRRDTNRQSISLSELLLSPSSRGKNDELLQDIKINAALDELIHSADTDVAEQKPLIIHINDFNALNMEETGTIILGKIRKAVDELWLSGRKVVVVGSCSTNDAPKPYHKALRSLEPSDRVIHISRRDADGPLGQGYGAQLSLWEKRDYLRENDENIVRMLRSMTDSDDYGLTFSPGMLRLDACASTEYTLENNEQFAKYWGSVLPIAEVYRIATTMLSLSSMNAPELFSLNCFERAARRISAVDKIRETAAHKSKAAVGSKQDPHAQETQKDDSHDANREKRLMSGMVNAQDMRTTFKDIHAPQATIESIKMLTTLSLIRPEAFSYGVLATDRIPGCLLYGPPGTGKTLLAKAVAKESGANMIEVSAASINNKYVGESEKNVRALFSLAKKMEPTVIFIDEADALLGARSGSNSGAKRETLNQFLREWDGMDKMKAFIMVATNRPYDLDEAVLRRLPRKLLIDLPLEAGRAAILRIQLRDEEMDESVSIEDIAKRTPLYSGSDLKNMCVAAAMAAVKEELEASDRHTGPEPYAWAKKRVLNRRHFDKALTEIGASVSEDMATLTAIRKFDERYGDSKQRKSRRSMGFGVISEAIDSEQARVRSGR